jgi:alpha-galactosidase
MNKTKSIGGDRSESATQRTADSAGFLSRTLAALGMISAVGLLGAGNSDAQVNGTGEKPYMGWTTWSMQAKFGQYPATPYTGEAAGDGFQNEWNIRANSEAMKSSGLQAHGFSFINIDGDWDNGLLCQCGDPATWDAYGRPVANVTRFPSGMASMAAYIHHNGQRAGIYWEGGVPPQVWSANSPILGTPYHVQDITAVPVPPAATPPTAWVNGYYNIDFTKPGAQEYINSIVKVFADWGFDYLKVDGIGPTVNGVPVYLDNIRAINIAVQKAGRPMYVNLSASLDHDYAYWWQRYSNGRRIDGDVECSVKDPACSAGSATGLANITEWSKVALRFTDLVPWQNDAGPHLGWNDFDSLEVGNGTRTTYPKSSSEFLLMSNMSPPPPQTPLARQPAFVDGLTNDERQSAVTLWSIGGSPLQLGDDLTLLDSFGIHILTNDEVLAVDQSGRHGHVVYEGASPVYEQALCDGSYYVALFNTNTTFASVTVNWVDLGFSGSADVRDLWAHQDMGTSATGYTVNLNAHASALLRVRPQSERQFENVFGCGPGSRR